MLAEHLTEVAMVVLAEVVSRVLLAVAVFVQFAYDVPAQVPAAARDRDGHHRAPSGGPQMSRWISKLVPLPTRPSTSSSGWRPPLLSPMVPPQTRLTRRGATLRPSTG
jgi:hypothetical protein